MKLLGVMIGSENPNVLGEFYTKLVGEPGWQQEDWYGYNIDGGSLMIGPHSEVQGKNQVPGRIIISFVTKDVQSEFLRIKELGAEVIAEPYQPNAEQNPDLWLATLADPDGNYIQLSKPWEN